MKDGPNITSIAALIGDHARAQALTALMSGMALTATELATEAGVTKQTTWPSWWTRDCSRWRRRAATATSGWPTATWRSFSKR
jgi:hypothetical protein